MRAVTIKLIKDNPEAHEIFAPDSRTETEAMAELKSVGMKEVYEARAQGLYPEMKFVLTCAEDYNGEHELTYEGARYLVLRTFMNGDGIELTVGRAEHV